MSREVNTFDLIEYASDPAFGIDENMLITGWNEAAVQLLGYPCNETSGKNCGQILQASYASGEPLCSMKCEGRSCFTKGQKWGVDACKIRHKSGKLISAGISSMVLPIEARKNIAGETVSIIFLHKSMVEEEEQNTESRLRISSLGQFGLLLGEKNIAIEKWKRKQAVTILKCLVCNLDKPVHRERLIEWLWPEAESENGWKRLKVTISHLRAKLREGGVEEEVIETVGQSYLVRSNVVWIDSDIFNSRVAQGRKLLKTGNLVNALHYFEDAESLYKGNFFEEEPYAEWCAVERERLLEIYLELLAGMVNCYSQQGKYLEAIRVSEKALYTDPSRENFIRALMENLVKLGRPDWARTHFLSWQKKLDREYALQPTRETLSAFNRLIETEINKIG